MPAPSVRYKILPARGDIAALTAAITAIDEGELCYALDEDKLYVKDGGVLVPMESGVTSVAGRTGAVVLVKADITDFSDADYATTAQGVTADSAIQPGDNVSTLTNDAGYITLAQVPADAVTSVNGQTGVVTLAKGDVGLASVDNTSDVDKPISTATQNALNLKADLVGGVIPNSQLPSLAISEYLGTVANEPALLALTGQRGDWAIRTDTGSTWVITTDGGSVITDWTELATPADAVTSVNGFTGTVVLGASDVGAATTAQGALADSATQPGDNISTLTNDAGYITLAQVPADAVTSVNGQTGIVSLGLEDLDNVVAAAIGGDLLRYNGTNWVNYADSAYATATQGTLADSAVQPGDNVSTLTNDAAYITSAGAPVQSVAGKTGAVTLVKGDVGLANVDNTSDDNKPISTATQSALDLKADLIGGVIPNSQLPSLAITEYLGTVASEAALLALAGQRGDWAIRTDTSSTWVVTTDGGSVITDWTELATPAGGVNSVNGFTGTVVLGASDVGAATAAQGALASTATQPGDNISTLTNNVGYITSAPGTNLGNSTASTTVTVTSSTGNNTTLPAATTSNAGVMTSSDKAKVNNLPSGVAGGIIAHGSVASNGSVSNSGSGNWSSTQTGTGTYRITLSFTRPSNSTIVVTSGSPYGISANWINGTQADIISKDDADRFLNASFMFMVAA